MRASRRSASRILLTLAVPVALAACAPAPIYKTDAAFVAATPQQVAASPGNFRAVQVVWGGQVIGVANFQDHTQLRILGHPLDASQRPRLKQPATGRFIAEVPGFLDPMNYPDGTPVTVTGHIQGTEPLPVGQASYTYPIVSVRRGDLHHWTPGEMRKGHPNISIGLGIGGWIH